MRYLILASLLVFSFGVNCAGCPPTPTPIPDAGVVTTPDAPVAVIVPDASAPVTVVDAISTSDVVVAQTPCQKMCANLLALQCEEAVKNGVAKCVETCDRVSSSGIVTLNVTCVIPAQSKTEVQKCGVRCK
jgi:hypothetical protein